jgi:hypothetical protein
MKRLTILMGSCSKPVDFITETISFLQRINSVLVIIRKSLINIKNSEGIRLAKGFHLGYNVYVLTMQLPILNYYSHLFCCWQSVHCFFELMHLLLRNL